MVDSPIDNINIQLGDILEIIAPENDNCACMRNLSYDDIMKYVLKFSLFIYNI